MRSSWRAVALSIAVLVSGAFGPLGATGARAQDDTPAASPGSDPEPIAAPLGISQPDQPAGPARKARPRRERKPAPKPRARKPAPTAPAAHVDPPATPQPASPPPGGATPAPTAEKAAPTPAPAPAPAAPSKPAPAPQGGAGPATGEFQPVIHARNAKVTTCMDNIVAQSASVIDTPHTAISTWSNSAPNDNIFQSVVGLTYPNKAAPNALAVLLAAPVGPTRCEGQMIQIYPTSQPCSALQAVLIKEGRTIGTLQALPVIELKNGSRDILMPSAGGGCVIVAIALK